MKSKVLKIVMLMVGVSMTEEVLATAECIKFYTAGTTAAHACNEAAKSYQEALKTSKHLARTEARMSYTKNWELFESAETRFKHFNCAKLLGKKFPTMPYPLPNSNN